MNSTNIVILDKDELCAIPGIDPDKVERYGTRFLKLVRDARRRYEELRRDKNDNASDIVPDPNHDIISISEDEFGDGDALFDQASTLDLDESTISSRFFPVQNTAADDSPDDFEPGPSRPASSKTRKRHTSKRPRRKNPGNSGPKTKTSKTGAKSRDRGSGRSFYSQKGSQKGSQRGSTAKASRPRIEMMPV